MGGGKSCWCKINETGTSTRSRNEIVLTSRHYCSSWTPNPHSLEMMKWAHLSVSILDWMFGSISWLFGQGLGLPRLVFWPLAKEGDVLVQRWHVLWPSYTHTGVLGCLSNRIIIRLTCASSEIMDGAKSGVCIWKVWGKFGGKCTMLKL